MDAIKLEASYLKCDAVGCDHQHEVPEITQEMVGTPCPKCGANLLTQKDFEDGKLMLWLLGLVNSMIGPVDVSDDEAALEAPMLSINPHAGAVTVKMKMPGADA